MLFFISCFLSSCDQACIQT